MPVMHHKTRLMRQIPPPNWVLRTAIGPAILAGVLRTAKWLYTPPPYWRGELALRSSRAQHRGAVLARVLPEHDPAAAAGRGERRERGLGPYLDLSRASGAPELFDAIGVHGGAGAPVTQIATAGAEGMWTLDSDIASVKSEGITALHAVPLKSFQKELAHGGVTIVGVKDVDV